MTPQQRQPRPTHLDLKKDKGLTVQWDDGSASYYSVALLRKMSPSADQRELRDQMAKNPLTVLPASMAAAMDKPLTVTDVQRVGHYALQLTFSDGHDTGIFSWAYLWQLSPGRKD